MKLLIAAATFAGLLGWGATTAASAADATLQRRSHHRQEYAPRYARPYSRPTYYDRPVIYRPYGLVPFFFGLSFPYR